MVTNMSEPDWEAALVLHRSLLDERIWIPSLDPRHAGPLRCVKRWALTGVPEQKTARWAKQSDDTLVLQTINRA